MSTPAVRVIETYDLLQVTPAPAGLLAVWVERNPEAPGRYRLEVERLDLLGVADVTEQRLHPNCTPDGAPKRYRETVALGLVDGRFAILDRAPNFAGIIRVGDDLREAAAGLDIPVEVFDALDWPAEGQGAEGAKAAGPSETKSGVAA